MLSQEAYHQLILGLLMSHLDYVNAILINLPKREIHKLQRIQNMAAKIVLCKSKYERSWDSLWELHWLPIHRQIQHKILTLVYKCMNGLVLDFSSICYQCTQTVNHLDPMKSSKGSLYLKQKREHLPTDHSVLWVLNCGTNYQTP